MGEDLDGRELKHPIAIVLADSVGFRFDRLKSFQVIFDIKPNSSTTV